MRGWTPVPGTAKARLVEAALAAFSAYGYADVGVHDLADASGVTVGSLYHHFGSKAGLYALIRTDVELRTLDRMKGAAATNTPDRPLRPVDVALVGLDYLAGAGYARLLGEPPPENGFDQIAGYFSAIADEDGAPVGCLLHAAWRTALAGIAEGRSVDSMRQALRMLAR